MTLWKPDFAVLSDLSANIFAVCILILIILLQAGQGAAPVAAPPASPEPIEATRDLRLIERAPLRAAEMVELLFNRRPVADGLRIDLFQDRIDIVGPRGTVSSTIEPRRDGRAAALERLDRLIAAREPGPPARLYVFTNRWYATVSEHLVRHGSAWTEMSVPAALRSQRGPNAGDAWSDAFIDLLARPLDKDRFRLALARLLAGGAGTGATGQPGGTPTGAGSPQAAALEEDLLQRWGRRFRVIFGFAVVALGVGAVLLIERMVPRPGLELTTGAGGAER